MTSDRQFLRLFAQLIIKELVKAAIRKVIELIMEERLIYDEWTGQPTRVHMEGMLGDELDTIVKIKGPKEHVREGGGYSQYSREIPLAIWDKLTPADPTRTQLGDRVKEAIHPLGLEVASMADHGPYKYVLITEAKVEPTDEQVSQIVQDSQRTPQEWGQAIAQEFRNRELATMNKKAHHPDKWKDARDRALGKVGDTEMRIGGLPDPRIGVVPSFPSINPFKPTVEVKGRDFTEDFKKGNVIEAFGKTFLVTDVQPDHIDMTNVATFEVTRTTGLTYDEKGSIAGMSGSVVVPQADNMSPAAVRKRLADFQGVSLHEVVAFKDVQIDGTDVRDFCFCCGDDDGHEIGCEPGCVGDEPECVAATSEHGIEIGDTVQSVVNGRSSGGDGVVTQINCSSHKVKWDLSGKENWWGINELEVLSRGERLFATFKDAAEIHGWKVPGESTSASSCSCANPECTWRNSLNCRYDAYSDLEERGAIE